MATSIVLSDFSAVPLLQSEEEGEAEIRRKLIRCAYNLERAGEEMREAERSLDRCLVKLLWLDEAAFTFQMAASLP